MNAHISPGPATHTILAKAYAAEARLPRRPTFLFAATVTLSLLTWAISAASPLAPLAFILAVWLALINAEMIRLRHNLTDTIRTIGNNAMRVPLAVEHEAEAWLAGGKL